MKTLIAATAVIASLAGASAAFAFEPTNGPRVEDTSNNIDRTVVGSITGETGTKPVRALVDSSNLNVVYGFDSGRGLKVGTSSQD